jgi:O-antigen ligase
MLMLSKKKSLVRLLWLIIIMILLIGLILSYTRAAWISLFIAFICVAVIRLRIKKGIIFLCLGLLLCLGLFFQGNIFQLLEGNRQDSSDNLLEHVSSLSNISTDASNMERINRWKCALEMFIEKPIFGWGPGTYQFQYAPFQLYHDKTIISSNRGDMGNAHSEYLSVLAESGLIGLFLFISLIIIVLYKAINMYYLNINPEHNILMLSFICALLTYFIHGLFNNFLDTDKASVAIWAIMSMIISLDIYIPKKQRL